MSKIYDKYLELKSSPEHTSNTLYLFKAGLFFIFIDNDAVIVSNLFDLKLCKLNDTVVKCGFPNNSLQKYLSLFKSTAYNVKIIPSITSEEPASASNYLFQKKLEKIANEILELHIDNLSVLQAYDFLYKVQNELRALK